MENEFGLKELYQVVIKTTLPLEINGRTFSPNETICMFDKIQISNISESSQRISAHGGYKDRDRVFWETSSDTRISFTQGIFSKIHFALMNNSKMIKKDNINLYIPEYEKQESDADGIVTFSHEPLTPLFIYDTETGTPIQEYTVISNTQINIGQPYKEVVLDYTWEYVKGYSSLINGEKLTEGTFVLTGRTKVKDDITGKVKTGIIVIPKLKLTSALSMRLGENADPIVGRLDAIACPVGERGRTVTMFIDLLDDEIDSDM